MTQASVDGAGAAADVAEAAEGPGAEPAVLVRRATVADVEAMAELINGYASRGEMLPKPLNQVYQNVRDFVVALEGDRIVGCGALHLLWENLGEIRSLAVDEAHRRRGIGGQIVQALLGEAEELGLPRVFALTYKPQFFAGLGFRTVERETLPRKIWVDCIDCIKFPQCDETAVIRDLEVKR